MLPASDYLQVAASGKYHADYAHCGPRPQHLNEKESKRYHHQHLCFIFPLPFWYYNYNDNNNDKIYSAIIMASHWKSSSSLFDECKLSTRWPPTLKPSPPTRAVSPLAGCYHPHPPLLSPKKILIYHPMEGGRLSQPRYCSKGEQPMRRLYITVAVVINTTAWWNLNLGYLTLWSGILPLDHCSHMYARNGDSCMQESMLNSV